MSAPAGRSGLADGGSAADRSGLADRGSAADRSGLADRGSLGGIFDMTGVSRGPDGIKRYAGLPPNLVHMLRRAVERQGAAEAVAETGGGPRLSYASLWDRAAPLPRDPGGKLVKRQLREHTDWTTAIRR
jgi:hypothetical protein